MKEIFSNCINLFTTAQFSGKLVGPPPMYGERTGRKEIEDCLVFLHISKAVYTPHVTGWNYLMLSGFWLPALFISRYDSKCPENYFLKY
jgi:hypothetical protein